MNRQPDPSPNPPTPPLHHAERFPLRSGRVSFFKGDILIPGDKSISHRALILSSQRVGTTRIAGLLEGEDVLATASALKAMGVPIEKTAHGEWLVRGVGVGGLKQSKAVLDMGNSGTSTRLLMGLVTPYPFTTFFTGDESLSRRPMARAMTPLSQMGAKFVARDGQFLPLAVQGTPDAQPITYRLPVASAQVKSALLLAALNIAGTTRVVEPTPTRDHTENMLRYMGFSIECTHHDDGETTICLPGKQVQSAQDLHIDVPADPSSAAFAVVAALLCKNAQVLIRNVCVNPSRTGLYTTLAEMGAQITWLNQRASGGEPVADLLVASSKLRGVVVPAARAPSMIDEYPILAVAAAFAQGETVMHGLAELRVKESDRLQAIAEGLHACGVSARVDGDTLTVSAYGEPPRGGATITTHFDHRIAMAFLVMGMASVQPVTVDDARAIQTSFPGFSQSFNALGADIMPLGYVRSMASQNTPIVVAIDGPAASGKGTLARRVAEYFGLNYLDTGSLYRAVGMKLVYAGADPQDRQAALKAALTIDADDLANPRLRQERIGQAASVISAYTEVRQALLDFQRDYARRSPGAVLDGRDIGTVVCPDADFKFFITATLYARARRRHKELQGQGIEVIFESVLEDLRERDERDEKRSIAPMRPADDAFIIDTSSLDADNVFDTVRQVILRRYPMLAA